MKMDIFIVSLAIVCFMTLNLPQLSQAQDTPKDFLAAHNAARSELGLPPLAWNDTVAAYAQAYSNNRTDCQLVHSGGPYGENLAWSSGNITADFAVNMWVGEKKGYNYESNSCSLGEGMCLHYTQIVWRDTLYLGCGISQCQNGYNFVTCSYDPPGNYIGQRPY